MKTASPLKTNLSTSETNTSGHLSIQDFPEIQPALDWLRSGPRNFKRSTWRIGDKCFKNHACFASLRIDPRLRAEPEVSVELCFSIQSFPPVLKQLAHEFADWAFGWKNWYPQIQLKHEDDYITLVGTNKTIDKTNLFFYSFVFRKIEWTPGALINWYLLDKLNYPGTKWKRLLAMSVFNPGITSQFVAPDVGHFLIGTPGHKKYLTLPDVEPEKIMEKHKLPLASNTIVAPLFFPEAAGEYFNLVKEFPEKAIDYAEISSNWKLHGRPRLF